MSDHNRSFHHRAINWLRDTMALDTEVLPTQSVASADAPRIGRLGGYVLPHRSGMHGQAVLVLMLVAGTVALTSSRNGLPPTLGIGLRVGAIVLVLLGLGVVMLGRAHERRSRRAVQVVLVADESGRRPVDVALLDGLRITPSDEIWVVAESGFTDDAPGVARSRGMRCFAARGRRIDEVHVAAP